LAKLGKWTLQIVKRSDTAFFPEERSEFRDLPVRARYAAICRPWNKPGGKEIRPVIPAGCPAQAGRRAGTQRRHPRPVPRDKFRPQRVWVPDFRPAFAGHASGMTKVWPASSGRKTRAAINRGDTALCVPAGLEARGR